MMFPLLFLLAQAPAAPPPAGPADSPAALTLAEAVRLAQARSPYAEAARGRDLVAAL